MDVATRRRYEGFAQTPPLWQGRAVSPYEQIHLPASLPLTDTPAIFKNHRLGKLVEEFVFHQLKDQPGISWLADNLQIQDQQRTVGELDALFYDNDVPVHLEVAYKFYLYDTREDHDEPLAYWIGPNQKDNLFFKLRKLHQKQFALLHNPLTKPYLDRLGLDPNRIQQQLCFKAQLFVPYGSEGVDFGPLNPACVVGTYIAHRDLALLKDAQFHIPAKLDWLVAPHKDVEWLDFEGFAQEIGQYVRAQRSPLVWVKDEAGEVGKGMVVFW